MNNTDFPTRILWIDYAKAFAIIMVVMIRIPILDPYRHIAYSFVMPIFFFLSGYLLSSRTLCYIRSIFAA